MRSFLGRGPHACDYTLRPDAVVGAETKEGYSNMVGSGNNVVIVIRTGNLAEEPLICVARQRRGHENPG